MKKWDEDDRAEILSNKVFILKNVIKQPMVYSPRLLDGTYIGLATYIMESDIVSAEDKEVITDWALENFNEWRDGKWRWTVPPEDRPVDFDYSFIIDLEEDTTYLSDDDNAVKGKSIWEEDIQRMIEARDLEATLAVKVECDECGTECPKSTSINWVDTCDGTARNVWWCKECYEEGKRQEPVICECCNRDFTDEVDDRSSFDEIGKIICMECFDEEEDEEEEEDE